MPGIAFRAKPRSSPRRRDRGGPARGRSSTALGTDSSYLGGIVTIYRLTTPMVFYRLKVPRFIRWQYLVDENAVVGVQIGVRLRVLQMTIPENALLTGLGKAAFAPITHHLTVLDRPKYWSTGSPRHPIKSLDKPPGTPN